MQLIILDRSVPKGYALDASELIFPVLALDVRDGSINLLMDENTIVPLGGKNSNGYAVEYAHRKRFGIVDNGVVKENVLAIDAILTADDLEKIIATSTSYQYTISGQQANAADGVPSEGPEAGPVPE